MDIKALAAEFGFAECYVFTTEPFDHFQRRFQDGAFHSDAKNVQFDTVAVAPWANAILGLVYPYKPYAAGVPLSAYYPSSNAAYHASSKLIRRMEEVGIQAKRIEVPVRELLIRSGVGTPLKSGLTLLPEFGTRYFMLTLVAQLDAPEFVENGTPQKTTCDTCRACEAACPVGAIDANGYDYKKCARAYMCGEPMEDWVMDAMDCMLGCEHCQSVCPYNRDIETAQTMPEELDLETLLSGNVKPALEIVGKNLNRQRRLIQHACVIAAKQGRKDLIPLIEPWLEDEREAVRVAAQYALKKLRV